MEPEDAKRGFRARVASIRAKIPRSSASDSFDVAGLGCLVGAAWWWQPIVGLVALGVAFLVAGWVTD